MSIQLIHALLGDGCPLACFNLIAARVVYFAPEIGEGVSNLD